jgi:hypothetical protein
MNRPTITAERIEPSGGWSISAILGGGSYGYRVQRSYYGYSKREALALFRQFIREEYQA